MSTRIFVNLPVKDLDRSMAFYERLDFELDLRFTNDSSACLEIADGLYLMLLTEARFRERIGGPSCDAQRSIEVLVSLALDSHQEVDKLLNKAVAAGAGAPASKPRAARATTKKAASPAAADAAQPTPQSAKKPRSPRAKKDA